jgi:tRNA pseudouridine13 synthase
MRSPEGVPAELEGRIAGAILGEGIDLARTRSLGEGTRRALRVWVEDLRCEEVETTDDDRRKGTAGMRVYFVLPKGAYATTVLATAFTIHESHEPYASDGESSEREESEAPPDEGDA